MFTDVITDKDFLTLDFEEDKVLLPEILTDARLVPDKVIVEEGLTIKQKIMPFGVKWNKDYKDSKGKIIFKKGELYKQDEYIKVLYGITVHNTNMVGTDYDAEQYTKAFYNQNLGTARVHYYVDWNEAWQCLQDLEVGWHAGDGLGFGNFKTIGIEIIMDGTNSKRSLQALANGLKLIAILMRRHTLELDDIYPHQKHSGKYCPRYIFDTIGWNNFIPQVQNTYLQITHKEEEKDMEKRYQKIEEVPEWVRPTVSRWIKDGILNGNEKGELNINDDMIRNSLMAERMIDKYVNKK